MSRSALPAPRPIDTLLLDIGDVLVDVRLDLARRAWAARTGRDAGTFDAVVFGDGRKDAFDRGALTAAAFFRAAAAAAGDPALRPALEAAYRLIVQPRPWVVAALRPLVGRLRLALLSNIDPVHHAVFAALPVAAPFGTAALSYRLRARKPEPAAYHGALALLGDPPPDRVLFVDDQARNVTAAHAAGLRAVRAPDEATLRDVLAALAEGHLP